MKVILFQFDRFENIDNKLGNGEDITGRQLRLLRNQDINEVYVLGGEDYLQHINEMVSRNRRLRDITVKSISRDNLWNESEKLIFIQADMVFSENVIKVFLNEEKKISVAGEFRVPERFEGAVARMDMDYIIEYGHGLSGIDCCAVWPIISVDLSMFGTEENVSVPDFTEIVDYSDNESFIKSIIEEFAKSEKGLMTFFEPFTIGNNYTETIGIADKNDRLAGIKRGSITDIKTVIKSCHADKCVLVHENELDMSEIKLIFSILGIDYVDYVFDGEDKLLDYVERELVDTIIALGSSELIEKIDIGRKKGEDLNNSYPAIVLIGIVTEVGKINIVADKYLVDMTFAKQTIDVATVIDEVFDFLMNLEAAVDAKEDISDYSVYWRKLSRVKGTMWKSAASLAQSYMALGYDRDDSLLARKNELSEWIKEQDSEFVRKYKFFVLPILADSIRNKAANSDDFKKINRIIGDIVIVSDDENDKYLKYFRPFVNNEYSVDIPEIDKSNDNKYYEMLKKGVKKYTYAVDTLAALAEKKRRIELEKEQGTYVPEKKKLTPKQCIINIKRKLKKIDFIKTPYYFLKRDLRFKLYQLIYPVKTKWIVFESYGGIDGSGYSCNTKALYEAMINDPDYFDYQFIWAFVHPQNYSFLKSKPNTIICKRGSKRYLKFCARAKYIFTNTGMPKYVKPSKHQEMVYMWHGKPLKKIGCSFAGESEGKRSKKQLIRDYTASGKRLTKLTSPAPIFTDIMADAYNLSPEKRKTAMVETGYPRNDFLYKYTTEDVLKIKMKLGIPLGKKVVLYAPTWRPFKWIGGKKFEHTSVLDLEALRASLDEDCVFLCRLHHLERDSMSFTDYPGFLYDVSMVDDVNELYIISDLLISDYSGTIFDFANLKRPIVLFMYDKEEYVGGANGLNFDLDFLPGPIVTTQDEMVAETKRLLESFEYDEKYRTFNEACNGLDGADCSIRTAKKIVEVNPEATKKQQFIINFNAFVRNTKLMILGKMEKIPGLRSENTKRIASYKDKYKGERCFLIGNGPSLRLADLNMLKDEYSFGCNMIYKVFERSEWRPTFLCASDRVVAQAASKELQDYPDSILWVSKTAYDLMEFKGDNLICVRNLRKEKFYVHGDMTDYYVPSIATVMTFMIELAMYMGFSEIYLLGVDFSIGRSKNDHFMSSYRDQNMTMLEHKKMRNMFKGEDIGVHDAQIRLENRALYAYQKLEKYSYKKGCRVYNATRGGMLEVFERANLDEVLSK